MLPERLFVVDEKIAFGAVEGGRSRGPVGCFFFTLRRRGGGAPALAAGRRTGQTGLAGLRRAFGRSVVVALLLKCSSGVSVGLVHLLDKGLSREH